MPIPAHGKVAVSCRAEYDNYPSLYLYIRFEVLGPLLGHSEVRWFAQRRPLPSELQVVLAKVFAPLGAADAQAMAALDCRCLCNREIHYIFSSHLRADQMTCDDSDHITSDSDSD